jgi:hypothetical protein
MNRTTALSAAAVWTCTLALAVGVNPDAQQQLPTTFSNLQVLPKDIAQRPLIDLMKSFSFGLDVRCEHCHVGEGNDLSKFDFASDAKPTKATARRMLKMMITINDELLAGVGEPPPPGAPKVTCYTCHRGATKPLTAAPAGGGS